MNEQRFDNSVNEAIEHLREVPPPDRGRQATQRQVFMSQLDRVHRSALPRQAAAKPTRRSFWPAGLASRRMALAGALVALVLVMVGGTGVIYAADAAVPGDALYAIDQTVESLRLGLTTRPQATARLLVALARERLAEAEELSSRGDGENLAVALDGFGTAVAWLAEVPAATAQEDANAVAALLDQEFTSQPELPVLPTPDPNNPDLGVGVGEEPGEDDTGACVGADPHPVAERLASQYPVSYEQVMTWFCEDHYGMGEIMLLLQTADKTGLDPTEILDMKAELGGWGRVWQELDLIGKGHKAAAEPTEDEDEDLPEDEELPDEEEPPAPAGDFCVGADPHPVGQRLADEYGVDYSVVMGWFCDDHFGMGEIKTALQVSGTHTISATGTLTLTAQDLLDLRAELGGWGQVWHSLGMNGKPKKLADDPAYQAPAGNADDKPGKGPVVKPPKEPKVKPDAATKPKPAKPVKPDKAAKPASPAKPPKPPKPPKD